MKKLLALLLSATMMLSLLTGCRTSKTATQIVTEGLEARETEISFRSGNVDETLNEVFQKNPKLYYYFSKYGGEHVGKDVTMTVEYANTDSTVPDVFVVDSYDTLYNVVGLALIETMTEVAMVITDSTLSADDITQAIEEWRQDNYLVYMGYDGATVDTKSTSVMSWLGCRLTIQYVEDTDEIQEWRTETEETLVELAQSLFALDMPEYRRELLIHDYLVENTTCEEEASSEASYTAYGALVEGKAVCEGYAEAAQLLFQAAGLQSYYVEGAAGSANHAWNCVQVAGEWYWVDVTWDDPVPADGGEETLSHEYFNLTDSQLNKAEHSWQAAKYPSCTSSIYNYDAVQTAIEEEDGASTDESGEDGQEESTGKTYTTYSARNVQQLDDEKYQVLTALGLKEDDWEALKTEALGASLTQTAVDTDSEDADQESQSQESQSQESQSQESQSQESQAQTSATPVVSQTEEQTSTGSGSHTVRNVVLGVVIVLLVLVLGFLLYWWYLYRRMLKRKRAKERARRRAAAQGRSGQKSGSSSAGRRPKSSAGTKSATKKKSGGASGSSRKGSSSSRNGRTRRENPFR